MSDGEKRPALCRNKKEIRQIFFGLLSFWQAGRRRKKLPETVLSLFFRMPMLLREMTERQQMETGRNGEDTKES
jgi:hypothetical protein